MYDVMFGNVRVSPLEAASYKHWRHWADAADTIGRTDTIFHRKLALFEADCLKVSDYKRGKAL